MFGFIRRFTAHCGAWPLLLALLLCTSELPAQGLPLPTKLPGAVSAVVQTAQVRAELVAHAPDGLVPGKPFGLGLLLTHQPHWHTYWQNPGDSGLATQLQWELPPNAKVSDIAWPLPTKIKVGSLANYGYEGSVLLPVTVTLGQDALASGDLNVKLFASWLVCSQECVPQEGHFELHIPVRGSTALHAAAFEAAQRAHPRSSDAKVRAELGPQGITLTATGLPSHWQSKALNVYPQAQDILDPSSTPTDQPKDPRAASQRWDKDQWTSTMALSPQRMDSPSSMPVVFAAGGEAVVATASISGTWPAVGQTPSTAPAPAASANPGVAADASQGLSWWLALASALAGGLILNLMPCVFPVLAIKVLSLVKQGAQHRSAQRMEGLSYSAGVVVSFVALGALMLALRAGGEQLGWGFQLQTPWVLAALALLFTLLGFNLAGMLEVGTLVPGSLASLQLHHPVANAFLSGVLAVAVASPCTAPFMGASLGYAISLPPAQALAIFAALGVGLALPFGVISWIPGLARCLPRPGPWMATLRHTMAFPMWATVVWLVWVHGHLSGVDGAASLLALLLTVALLVWAFNRPEPERKVLTILALCIVVTIGFTLGGNILKMQAVTAESSDTQWQPWTPERVRSELAAGTPVFVDFTAAWCITCQYNKKTTLNQAEVLRDFEQRKVRLLRADWTRRDPAITQALQELGRSGVPVYVLYQRDKPARVLSEILTPNEIHHALSDL